jgi:signal transduction histidine kinase
MRLFGLILIFHFFGLFFLDSQAQSDIQIRSWGQDHGIESAVIFGVFQDKNNLIWICTYNGLYYFDGFRAYKSQILEGKEKISFDGVVSQLLQTTDGRYWLKAGEKFGVYDIYSKVFTPLQTQPTDLLATFQSIEDSLYIVDSYRTFLVDKENLEIIQMVFVDNQGRLISDRVKVSGSSGKFYSFKESFPVEIVPTDISGRLVENKKSDTSTDLWNEEGYFKNANDVFGNFWYKKPFSDEWIVHDPLGSDISKEMLLHFEGLIVLNLHTQSGFSSFFTDNGLMIWEKNAAKPRYLFEEIPELNDSRLINIFDKEKTVWISNRLGIHNIIINPSRFNSITKDKNELFSDFILGIYPFDDNRLIIKHDFPDQYYSVFDQKTGGISKIHEEELFKVYGFSPYRDLIKHGDPKKWILKYGDLIHHLPNIDPNGNPFSSNIFISDGKEYDYLVYPLENRETALQLWRISDNKLIFPKINPLQFADQGDTVWIGTHSEGLVALHTPTGQNAQWLSKPSNSQSIPSNRVHAVIPVANGNLWLGTGKGLSYFDKKAGVFTSYHTQQGLIDDRIYCMAFDAKGYLWIGTGNGLSRFDTLNKTFSNFTKADGLVNSEYNRNSAILLDNGRMMMGGMQGIDIFDPDEIDGQIEKPMPKIAHVQNNEMLINFKSQFDFEYDKNHFDFFISSNPIWMASNLTYQYRLEGAEDRWQTLNYSNVVHYPNLPPGEYSFQVKIANQPEIATYDFTIHRIWYTTWWFRMVFMAIGILLIYQIYKIMLARRIYRLEQENRVMQLKAEQAFSVNKERERIIADLHDDVGATLSSLHIYGDLAGKIWDSQPEKGKEMVDKIGEQSRELMGRMSDIIWSMKSTEEERQSFSFRLKNYGTDLLASKNIEVVYNIDENLVKKIQLPDIRKNLLMIGKEAMNNIAKHSQASKVKIELHQEGDYLAFKISDDGKGFDMLLVQKGNGLGNIQQRCEKIQGQVKVESVNGWGTQISCLVPMARISLVD